MAAVHYDCLTLIDLVESRPCLWDKTQDVYKDKVEKQKAWREIFQFLEPEYTNKDKEEQIKIGLSITTKWNNIRDAFVRSLKRKSGQSTSKKYLYHDHLEFLMKIVQKDDTSSSLDDDEPTVKETEEDAEYFSPKESNIDTNVRQKHSSKKIRLREDIDRQILNALTEKKELDADEAFFVSILPMVKRMTEEEKIDFRMNILQFMKDIHNKRKMSPLYDW